MLRSLTGTRLLAALAVAALAVPFAAAQERGENINGFITEVSGRNVVVKNDDGREIRIRVTPSTEVYFQDSGDRKLFPNPTIGDLRSGMGVHFNYNDGAPDRVIVHFVPEGFVRGSGPATGATEQVRGRIQSIDRLGRDITVRADGRTRTYELENRGDARGFRSGDMVLLTVRDGQVVTRIEAEDGGDAGDVVARNGTITRIVTRTRSVTIDVAGREQVYEVANSKLLQDARVGDMVLLTVRDGSVVTRIEAEDGGAGNVTSRNGTITRIGARNRSVTIEVNGREDTYEVLNTKLLEDARVGDRVRFEVEERAYGRRVVTSMERR
jgi:hypothetical protein